MALKVVGSGLGRTGTKSLHSRAEQPGPRPLPSHGRGVRPPPEHAAVDRGRRRAAGLGRHLRRLWFGGRLSHRRLLARTRRPLSGRQGDPHRRATRTSGSNSTQATIFAPQSLTNAPGPLQAFFTSFIGPLREHLHDRAYMTDYFLRHTEEVKATIPPERLLIYEAGEGWAPLCGFLGVPVPAEPYPSENSRAEFIARSAAARAASETAAT